MPGPESISHLRTPHGNAHPPIHDVQRHVGRRRPRIEIVVDRRLADAHDDFDPAPHAHVTAIEYTFRLGLRRPAGCAGPARRGPHSWRWSIVRGRWSIVHRRR